MSQPKKRFGRSRGAADDTQHFALTDRDKELAELAAEILPRNSAAASFEKSASRKAGSSSVSARDAVTDHELTGKTSDDDAEGRAAESTGDATAETPAERRKREREARRRERQAAKAEAREGRSADYQPTPTWYKVVMIGLMVIGLLWIIAYYLFQGAVPIPGIGGWNLGIGLAFMFVGLILTTRWR